MPDLIELHGLRVDAICGVLPHERTTPQPLEIDVDLEADLSLAGRSDDLADTIDYGLVTAAADHVASTLRPQLLEHLAEQIAREVLAVDARIDAVTVAVRKLEPPVPQRLATSGVRITRPMRAFLALGSNLGDREAYLRGAIDAMPDLVAVSPIYETEPLGSSGRYLNAVVELDTALTPRQLLELCARLETAADRRRDPSDRYAPRTLDVDVLVVGDLTVDEPDLQVPHPRMWERPFVLIPLADLAPDLVPDPPVDEGVVPFGG